MIIKTNILDENFGEREIGTMFNLAMMTQIDEIHSSRHLNMQFIEFAEAISRVAEKAYNARRDLLLASTVDTSMKRKSTKRLASSLDMQGNGKIQFRRQNTVQHHGISVSRLSP